MLYYKNLWNQVFETFPRDADEVKILSGYVGPIPASCLKDIGIKSTIIFGLFKENRKQRLHEELVKLHSDKSRILYPEILAHSKCYVWLKNNVPIRALVGSANFSSNGLKSDYREVLFEVDERQSVFINSYIDIIERSAVPCNTVIVDDSPAKAAREKELRELVEDLTQGRIKLNLLDRRGDMPSKSGLNWGMAEGSHVRPNDAYIAIRKHDIMMHPEIFMPRHELPPGESSKGNLTEVVELIWDDGEVMQARFEGTQYIPELGNQKYPKQLASFPHKDILGRYFRTRLNVQDGAPILKQHLMDYGTTHVELSLVEEGVYAANFKPPKNHRELKLE